MPSIKWLRAQELARNPATWLVKRSQVRVVVPPRKQVFTQLRVPGKPFARHAGRVRDISANGMAVELEGPAPAEGDGIVAELVHEGVIAIVAGSVVAAGTRHVSVVFAAGESVNLPLLRLIAQLTMDLLQHQEREGRASRLKARLLHERFFAGGVFDLRVQAVEQAWWQMTFLEFLITWSQEEGLATATLDRSAQDGSHSMEVHGRVTRHPAPSLPLVELARELAALILQRMPAHADVLSLLGRTLTTSP